MCLGLVFFTFWVKHTNPRLIRDPTSMNESFVEFERPIEKSMPGDAPFSGNAR